MNGRALLISSLGHAGVILILLLVQGFAGPGDPLGGGDAVMVTVVTVGEPGPAAEQAEESLPETVEPASEDLPPELQEDQVEPVDPEDTAPVEDATEDVPEDGNPVHVANPPEDQIDGQEDTQAHQAETAGASSGYIAVDAAGEPGGGAPGPATYEGRVFSAIRRNFRTSAVPEQSYRIEITVGPDGSMEVETLRTSGVDVFDRAVEHALAMAQMPPFPPGRTSPAVLRIEFLGLDGEQ